MLIKIQKVETDNYTCNSVLHRLVQYIDGQRDTATYKAKFITAEKA